MGMKGRGVETFWEGLWFGSFGEGESESELLSKLSNCYCARRRLVSGSQ
jgi:hypothetical protein